MKLNTSLPTTASGYEITCSAEVENWDELNHTIGFEWMRNGHKLTRKTYQGRICYKQGWKLKPKPKPENPVLKEILETQTETDTYLAKILKT